MKKLIARILHQIARKLVHIAVALSVVCLLLCVAGCTTTVTKAPITSSQPSWDGTNQNSGIIDLDQTGALLITQHALDRYNAMILVYGNRFVPPVQVNDGVTPSPMMPGVYRMDEQHARYFNDMNLWRKAGSK
jgi:hypothetical protein